MIAYEYVKRIRASRKRFADAVRVTAGCIDCGATEGKLDFDHRPNEVKCFPIARGGTWAWPRFIAEVMKCDVRCTSCHQRRHLRIDPQRMRGLIRWKDGVRVEQTIRGKR